MARNYLQGSFQPKHPDKYAGDPNGIVFRSSWEKKMMIWADTNPSVLKWASEECAIPYLSPVDGRMHRYFVDFIIRIKNTAGEIKNYMVEIKPDIQTKPPKARSRNTQRLLEEHKTFAVNQAKWRAAEEFCRNKNMSFIILTERDLFG